MLFPVLQRGPQLLQAVAVRLLIGAALLIAVD
jgi:hypothetical protein